MSSTLLESHAAAASKQINASLIDATSLPCAIEVPSMHDMKVVDTNEVGTIPKQQSGCIPVGEAAAACCIDFRVEISPLVERHSCNDNSKGYAAASTSEDDLDALPDYVLVGKCNLSKEEEDKIAALAQKLKPELPMLVVRMTKEMCSNDATLYFRHKQAFIMLQLPEGHKEWPCKLSPITCKRVRLSLGDFYHDNSVQKGDLCLFQQCGKRAAMTVHVLRKVNIDGPSSCGPKPVLCTNHGEEASCSEEYSERRAAEKPLEHGDLEGASGPSILLSENAQRAHMQFNQVALKKIRTVHSGRLPIWVEKMSKSNVAYFHSGGRFRFNVRYCDDYLPVGRKALVLQRMLKGELKEWRTEISEERFILGWNYFALDNYLRLLDMCLFQLMERKSEEELRMMVHIIRREKYGPV